MSSEIPHINLAHYRDGNEATRREVVKTLGDGLQRFGFLTLEGHGLDVGLSRQCYDLFKRFYALDEETKRKYDRVPLGARGYAPFGREHAKYTDVPDLKEFYHIGQELPEGHPYRKTYPDNVWPDEVPELRDVAVRMFRDFESCAAIILQALAEYYDLPATTFSDMIKDGDSVYRIVHYPPIDESMPKNAIRAAAHEDINLLTLLIESEGRGLEILTRDKRWIPVGALEGHLVVDSGDMLRRITNATIPATTHRVVNPPDSRNESRYSMPFFVQPYHSCSLNVLPHFVSADNPAKWPPISAVEFLHERLRAIGMRQA